jgi:hypothetical protein
MRSKSQQTLHRHVEDSLRETRLRMEHKTSLGVFGGVVR